MATTSKQKLFFSKKKKGSSPRKGEGIVGPVCFALFIALIVAFIIYMIVIDVMYKKKHHRDHEAYSAAGMKQPECITGTPPGNPSSLYNWTYRGCYVDTPSRAFPMVYNTNNMWQSSTASGNFQEITPQECISNAVAAEYDAVGFQDSTSPGKVQCFAGKNPTYSKFGCSTSPNNCNYNSAGPFTNVVYTNPSNAVV